MSTKYLDSTGLSYFWGKLKAYFQPKLVSGTNIKTINNTSLLGSGNIAISGGGIELSDMAGMIQMYGGTFTQVVSDGIITQVGGDAIPPNGWALCDGSAISRTEYAELFNRIGTRWGTGDGSSTFNLPDLRGRAPIGAGTGSGLTARTLGTKNIGAETVTLTAAQSGVPAHSHKASATANRYFLVSPDTESADQAAALSGSGYYVPHSKVTGWQHNASTQNNTAANASSAHTNMQPSAVVNFIICLGRPTFNN